MEELGAMVKKETTRIFRSEGYKARRCPMCGSRRVTKNGFSLRKQTFQCKRCRARFRRTTGTLFHHSRLSRMEWLLMVEMIHSGQSIKEISQRLDRPYITVWRNIHKLKKFAIGAGNGGRDA